MKKKKKRTDIEELWCALSDIFVDNETPYQEMAKRISHHDLDVIEFHLFYNVAPVCASNLYASPPRFGMVLMRLISLMT